MNFVKRSLEGRGTRSGVVTSGGVEALVGASLLPTLDFLAGLWLASSSSSSVELAGVLMQRLRRAQNPRAMVKIWLWCCFSTRASWSVGYRAFRIVK